MDLNIYYDHNGQPITQRQWDHLIRSKGPHRFVARTSLTDPQDHTQGYEVWTVWLGIDYRFPTDDGPPLIYESLVFQRDWRNGKGIDDPSRWFEPAGADPIHMDGKGDRYATRQEAEAGHMELCREITRRYAARDAE